jgi:hypothetical protein
VFTRFTGRDSVVNAVLLEPNGELIAAGLAGTGASTTNIASARYLPSGQVDPSFGTAGQSLTPPPPNADIAASAAALNACSFVTVSTWSYANNTVPQNAMGIARFRR